MRIEKVDAREIFDSRGFPTVEAKVELECGAIGVASVPSGASTGSHEAHELRDGGKRLMGKGVTRAVDNVRGEIAKALIGRDADDQKGVDAAMEALDGTESLSRLGANAVLAVSLATAEAAADAYGMELYRYLGGVQGGRFPLPMMNVLNGGAHASNNVDIQEFMLVPVGADSFERAMRMCVEAYHALKSIIHEKGLATTLGDEGGFAPNIESDEEALDLMTEAVARAGMTPGKDIAFALDVAASEWFDDGAYVLPKRGTRFTREQLIDHIAGIAERHPIVSIEDPLNEDDFEGFAMISKRLPNIMIVGDDLYVTNAARLKKGIEMKSSSAILIKLNQAGSLSRTLETIETAKRAGMDTIISHRSGETDSTFIADLAVAVNARYIKTGAPARAERVAKYNRLLAIEAKF